MRCPVITVNSDKSLERERYDSRARQILAGGSDSSERQTIEGLPPVIRAPYDCYREYIRRFVEGDQTRVLEIGAGTGRYTEPLLQAGARVTATDISMTSLEVLQKKWGDYENLAIRVADMEALPFEDEEFEIVLNAGSLSYGDNLTVMNEIYRVLKTGGRFICVDSLNHNPAYRLNRWIQYLRKKRSKSTLQRMPKLDLIEAYRKKFGSSEVHYFGSIVWLTPLLNCFLSEATVGRLAAGVDRFFDAKAAAFKFVMVVEKNR